MPQATAVLIAVIAVLLAIIASSVALALWRRLHSARATERAMREREAHYRSLLRTVPILFWLKDRAGKYLVSSDAVAAFHGRLPEELPGRTASELFAAEVGRMIADADEQVLQSGVPHQAERMEIGQDGAQRWFESHRIPVLDPHGQVTGLVGFMRDITARKQSELQLERQLRYAEALAKCSRLLLFPNAAEAELQPTLNAALAIIRQAIGGDHLTIARYTNVAVGIDDMFCSYRLLAKDERPDISPQLPPTREEILDMPLALNVWRAGGGSFNGPVSGEFSDHPIYQRYLDANGVKSVFIQSLEVGGRWWGHITVKDYTAMRAWDVGAVQLLQTAAEMIVTYTEGWEAAHALREREALLREMEKMGRIGGGTYDLVTGHVQWSPQVYALHEWDAPTPPSVEHCLEFFDPDDRMALEHDLNVCAQEGTPWERECWFTSRTGRRLWVRLKGQPVFVNGVVTQLRGTIQDITDRKEAELALVASETKYRALFELLPVGVTLADQAGQIVEVNSAAVRVLDLPLKEHVERKTDDQRWDIITPEGAPFAADEYPSVRALREQRIITDVEMGVRRSDGSRAWLSVSAAPLTREPYGIVVTYNDITARKVADDALADQLRYAEALARCSRILLVEGADATGWETVVKPALAELRGAVGCARLALAFTAQSDAAVRIAGRLVVDDNQEALPAYERQFDLADTPPELRAAILRGDTVCGAIAELFSADSAPHRYFSRLGFHSVLLIGAQAGGAWRGHLIVAESGERLIRDAATERFLRIGLEMITAYIHQWEITSALRERETQLRVVGDNLPNGFIYQYRYDSLWQPSFTYLSGSVEQILGVAAADVMRDSSALHGLIPPAEAARVAEAERRSATGMADFTEVVQHVTPDGETRWLYLSSRPRREPDGGVVWDGVAVDVTERQHAASELERARDAAEAAARAKSAFLANMSHEIRTPLNAVIGMATLLRDTQLTTEQQAFINTIITGGNALLALINDILDFSRLEAGRMELAAEPFELHDCLSGALDLVAYQAREKGLSVTCAIAADVPRVVIGDAGRFWQVLLNLLSNAVKFTDAGSVALEADARAVDARHAELTVRVRDTGIGIAQDRLNEIFDPFVQSDTLTARRYGGTGLGLAICRQIVGQLGGQLDVVSALGVGSTFRVRVTLPIAELTLLPRRPVKGAEATRPLRILIAEDNLVNQEVTRRMLARQGHVVTVVGDGPAAIDAVTRATYDIVFMDVQMPGMDGEAATRHIRALGATIRQPRIIALTAMALPGDAERYRQAGMDDYLSKPIETATLQQILAHPGDTARAFVPAVAAPEAETDLLVDWDELERVMRSLGPEQSAAAALVLQLFSGNVPQQLDALDAAIAGRDPLPAPRAAHRLRGACLQIGARAMAALCRRMEQTDDVARQRELMRELRDCYSATLAMVQVRLTEFTASPAP